MSRILLIAFLCVGACANISAAEACSSSDGGGETPCQADEIGVLRQHLHGDPALQLLQHSSKKAEMVVQTQKDEGVWPTIPTIQLTFPMASMPGASTLIQMKGAAEHKWTVTVTENGTSEDHDGDEIIMHTVVAIGPNGQKIRMTQESGVLQAGEYLCDGHLPDGFEHSSEIIRTHCSLVEDTSLLQAKMIIEANSTGYDASDAVNQIAMLAIENPSHVVLILDNSRLKAAVLKKIGRHEASGRIGAAKSGWFGPVLCRNHG